MGNLTFNELQEKDLNNALIDAFPNMSSLEIMLSFELGKNLRVITGEGSLQEIVFQLVKAADAQGWVESLICAASNHNPGNHNLQRIIQKISLKRSNDLRRMIEKLLEYEYDNVNEIGRGNFGITYSATIKNQQKYIVIKTIKIEDFYQDIKSNNQEALKEFSQVMKYLEKEADFLLTFKHSNIVKYHNCFTQKLNLVIHRSSKKQGEESYSIHELELLFLVMEYIKGENLEDFVSKRGSPLQEAEALHYIKQIGEALTVVHDKSVLHRDIKPQNIMVCETTKNAVLIDFGIAREFNPMATQTQTQAFTPGYAPPEQLELRSKRGNYTDIYSLAATLYYLLTKVHPPRAFERKFDSSSFVEPNKINPSVSDAVNDAILWGMRLEPSERPQTVQQWLAKLFSYPTLSPSDDFSSDNKVDYNLEIFKFEVVAVNRRGAITKRKSKTAQYFRENLGNNVTLEMVTIPSGKFMMGSPSDEAQRYDEESPQHEVTVPAFFMGKYPVTQAQWRAVANLKQVSRKLNPDPSDFKGDNFPIEQISWYEAVEFCDRLSKNTGQKYRLPSEAEWEYACRAGTTTPFHFGETITSDLANYNAAFIYCDEAKGKSARQITPVGSFVANAFGLYDMHGNVWEWCYDHWHDNYESAPNDGSAWINEDQSRRMRRGGCWSLDPKFCRSAYRNHYEAGSRNEVTGFRVVVSAART